jgi:glycosyltransferase involved in cell wall biosynthesis
MLDIGVIIPELAKYGGAERLLIECLARWQYKHKLTVYASTFNHALLREHGIADSVTLKQLSPQLSDNPFSFFLNASFTPKLWSGEIGRHEVYHTHLWPMHLLDISPCVWYPHEPLRMLYDLRNNQDISSFATDEQLRVHIYPKYTYDTVQKNYFKPMRRAAEVFDETGKPDRIVANSLYCAEYIERIYKRKACRVVYPGVTVDDFLPPMADNYLLSVSQLWPHKRIDLIIESLRLIDDMQLYVVGSGPEKKNLEDLARRLGVYDRTFFLSGLTNRELQIVFSRALAVVLTPVREPFGIVALEAMAASKPLIAVNEGGYTEVVSEDCAFLIPPYVNALAEKVSCLRQNPERAHAMGRAGHGLAGKYTWDRTARELLEEIEEAREEWLSANVVDLGIGKHGPLFGAHYYGWYGNGLGASHWNDDKIFGNVTDMPVLGYYTSCSGAILEQHLGMAADIGLDFLCFNLHIDANGVSPVEHCSLLLLLAQAADMNSPVKVYVQLCCYDCTETDLINFFATMRSTIFQHKSYLTHAGLPVLNVFWTGDKDGDRAFLSMLRSEMNAVLLIASSLRMYKQHTEPSKTDGIFDGWSLFSPLELGAEGNWERIWSEAYAENGAGTRGLRCLTVSPGYDDRHLLDPRRQGNSYRYVMRGDGATYRRMINFALSVSEPPDFIFISTFNEMHENTHIEPTVSFGTKYLDLSRDFIRRGKDLWRG